MRRVTVTGHRPDKLNNEYDLNGPVTNGIRVKLQEQINLLKPDIMISGLALGIDMIWAELALDNNIKLTAAIPCMGQEKTWPKTSQDRYNKILANGLTTTVLVSMGKYSSKVMQKRNEWMVDQLASNDSLGYADRLIAVWDGSPGGTANCVKYAMDKLREDQIIYIPPETRIVPSRSFIMTPEKRELYKTIFNEL